MRVRRAISALLLVLGAFLPARGEKVRSDIFTSGSRTVHFEVFEAAQAETTQKAAPLLILLPGTSGPDAPLYRAEADFFAKQGYTTLMLHFFDAAGSRIPEDETYRAWSTALLDLVHLLAAKPGWQGRPVFVLGFSLGASIALAAGSQDLPVQGIAEWYGSLPDNFFFALKSMPPLLILHGARDTNIPIVNAQQLIRLCEMESFDCSSHIYPDEGHGFGAGSLHDAEQRTLEFFQAHMAKSGDVPRPR